MLNTFFLHRKHFFLYYFFASSVFKTKIETHYKLYYCFFCHVIKFLNIFISIAKSSIIIIVIKKFEEFNKIIIKQSTYC